jgi:hypothetical protein
MTPIYQLYSRFFCEFTCLGRKSEVAMRTPFTARSTNSSIEISDRWCADQIVRIEPLTPKQVSASDYRLIQEGDDIYPAISRSFG